MLQHCPDLRHVMVKTRSGDHRARSKHTESGSLGSRVEEVVGAARSGVASLPLDARCTGGGEFSPFRVAVATLCPFLLPPIRRHRSVIRNCVSLSSPYPIRLYGPTIVRTRSYVFLFLRLRPGSLDLSVAPPLRLPTIIVRLFPFR